MLENYDNGATMLRIEKKTITAYRLFLKENSRPPSRGGNTNALHSHVIEIEGTMYSFLALGSQQWIFKRDIVSFEYEINGSFKNIKRETIVTCDKNGKKSCGETEITNFNFALRILDSRALDESRRN